MMALYEEWYLLMMTLGSHISFISLMSWKAKYLSFYVAGSRTFFLFSTECKVFQNQITVATFSAHAAFSQGNPQMSEPRLCFGEILLMQF